jgi:hypothetical protein
MNRKGNTFPMVLIILAMILITVFFLISKSNTLSIGGDCADRTLLDLEGKKFSSLDEVQNALGVSNEDFALYANTFDLKVEDGAVTACPLEPEAFS